jgi:hypothetical protein
MLAVGNVGAERAAYADGSLFLTRDGGRTWAEVQRGPYLTAFGDRGALLVLVRDGEPTDRILSVSFAH